MTQGTSSYMQQGAPITVGADGTFSLAVKVDGLYTVTTVAREPLAPLPASAKSTPFPTQCEPPPLRAAFRRTMHSTRTHRSPVHSIGRAMPRRSRAGRYKDDFDSYNISSEAAYFAD